MQLMTPRLVGGEGAEDSGETPPIGKLLLHRQTKSRKPPQIWGKGKCLSVCWQKGFFSAAGI
jgi:hypothetical protein